MRRTAMAPSTTTGRSTARLMPMIATSGALMMGVLAMPPSLPRLVSVIVEPASSSRVALLRARRFGHAPHLGGDVPQRPQLHVAHHRAPSALPAVCVAMPRCTAR